MSERLYLLFRVNFAPFLLCVELYYIVKTLTGFAEASYREHELTDNEASGVDSPLDSSHVRHHNLIVTA